MSINNETFGISAEVAIAKSFNISINPDYVNRSDKKIVDLLINDNNIIKLFEKENIPIPIKHIAENQNPVDFLLLNSKTLSVKTNKGNLGKVAPQYIGQPTCETYFKYFEKYFKNFSLENSLKSANLTDNYQNRSYLFKKLSIENIDNIISMYWENLFDCDYYLHFFNLNNFKNPIENYIVFEKNQSPIWDKEQFSFTKSLNDWNESNTVKYHNISIGEFQVHRKRNCFKFRFDIKNIIELQKKGLINFKKI